MSTKKYWKGLPELTQSEEFLAQQQNEFAENLPIDEVIGNKAENNEGTSRRDFLKSVWVLPLVDTIPQPYSFHQGVQPLIVLLSSF